MAFGDKKLYIAKKIGVENDDYGNQLPYFDIPRVHCFSYMPTSGQVDYQIYGTLINNMFTAYLPMRYLGCINSGDVAYLIDGENQNIDELVDLDYKNKYCEHANYRVKLVQPQNVRVKIIFEKIKQLS